MFCDSGFIVPGEVPTLSVLPVLPAVSCGPDCLDSSGVCQTPCRLAAEEMAFQAGMELGFEMAEEMNPGRLNAHTGVMVVAVFSLLGALFFGGIGFFLGMQFVLHCVGGVPHV